MKKILFTLAAVIITAGTAYANWQEGSTSSLAVSGGEAAIQINLSAEQRLGINLNAVNAGKTDAVFSTAINESNLILSDLPVALYGENGRKDASYYPEYNNKILVSWRMFPTDDSSTGFDLYRKSGNEEEVKLNDAYVNVKPVVWCLSSNFYIDATFLLL